jgi:hypothetical protein
MKNENEMTEKELVRELAERAIGVLDSIALTTAQELQPALDALRRVDWSTVDADRQERISAATVKATEWLKGIKATREDIINTYLKN